MLPSQLAVFERRSPIAQAHYMQWMWLRYDKQEVNLKKSQMLGALAITGSMTAVAVTSLFIMPGPAEANISFARTTGLSCADCHADAANPTKNALTSIGISYRTCVYNPTPQRVDCNVQAKNQFRNSSGNNFRSPTPPPAVNNGVANSGSPFGNRNTTGNSKGGFGGSNQNFPTQSFPTPAPRPTPAPAPANKSTGNVLRDILLGVLGVSSGSTNNNQVNNPGLNQPNNAIPNNALNRNFVPPRNFDIGQSWVVSEQLGNGRKLSSGWSRRPGTNFFDATYIDSATGAQTQDVITYNGIRNGQVSFRRQSTGTVYTGKLTPDGRMVLGGTTNQRARNLTWTGTNTNAAGNFANTGTTGRPNPVPVSQSRAMDYLLFDIASDRTDSGFPQIVNASSFPGLWPQGMTAVYNGGNGKAYFFRGNQYVRYDINSDRSDPGYPQPINGQTWPGLWTNGIDAAYNGGNGKVYFFRGNQYMRYDIAADRTDPGYPKPINNQTWPGLPALGRIESAVNAGNGKIYFFSGNRYVRYDIAADRADPGYPAFINAQNWQGVWTSGITMATSGPGKLLFFHAR